MRKISPRDWFVALAVTAFLTYTPMSSALQSTSNATKARYVPGVQTLVQSHQFFRENDAPTYWKMSPYYIGQYTDSSCSLASATMIINAILSPNLLYTQQKVATEKDVLARVNDRAWTEGIQPFGIGATLDQMKELMPKALAAYGLKNYIVTAVHIDNNSKETQEKLHTLLSNNEKTGQSFMIASFQHQTFTGDGNVGHFSPIGAYDAKNKRALIMDSFRYNYEPYWVPLDLLVKGMMTIDKTANNYRGYLLVAPKS